MTASASRRNVLAAVVVGAVLAAAFAAWQSARGENLWGNAGHQQIRQALAVAAGEGFGRHGEGAFHPSLFLRPVYTLLLVPFTVVLPWDETPFRLAVAAFQGALLALTGAAAGTVLARRGCERAARLLPWATLASPLLLSQAASVVDTIAFTAAFTLAWAAAFRAIDTRRTADAALAGAALGLAVLTRSTALAVLPVLVGGLLLAPAAGGTFVARVRAVLLALTCAVAVLVPWLLRNHALTDRWMLSTVDGVNLWMGNNDHTAEFLDARRSLDELPGRGPLDGLQAVSLASQLEAYDRSRALASAWIEAHPGEAAALAVRKAGLLWTPEVFPRSTRSRLHDTKDLVSFAWTVLLYATALAGAWIAVRDRRLRGVAIGGVVVLVVFTLPHALAWAGTRLRVPVEPVLLTFSVVAADAVLARFRRTATEPGAAR